MPDPTEQATKHLRPWRSMAAWAAAVMLVLGIIWAAAVVATRKGTTGGETSLEREQERLAELKTAEFRKWATEAEDTDRDRDKRAYAVLRIAELGSEASARFLAKAWDAPLNVLGHEKLCLIDWAGEYGGSYCVPMLKKALSCPAPDERWHAARALLQIEGTGAIPLVAALAEKDPDGTVRSQTREFMSDAVNRAASLSDRSAIVRTVVQWGKSLDAGPYIGESVVYLLRQDHPTATQSDLLRLYSMAELKLLDKTFQAYAIHGIRIADSVTTAVLKKAMDPPYDPVPFPYAGWTLNLEKKDGTWSVVKAVKNESRAPDASGGSTRGGGGSVRGLQGSARVLPGPTPAGADLPLDGEGAGPE